MPLVSAKTGSKCVGFSSSAKMMRLRQRVWRYGLIFALVFCFFQESAYPDHWAPVIDLSSTKVFHAQAKRKARVAHRRFVKKAHRHKQTYLRKPFRPSPTAWHPVKRWRRPAKGAIVRGRNGINILARYGSKVRAVAPGQVVYSGTGLRGYGRLIIVRHANYYLTAYAHNSRLLVREGQKVKAGQVIGRVGRTDLGRAMLHFEIRWHGRPVNPMAYLI